MTQLLDEQIAARMIAECRDTNELHRFQRAVYITEGILEAYGLAKTVKVLRKMRAEAGLIPEQPPAMPPPPLPLLPGMDQYTPEMLSGESDPLTGKRRRKKPETGKEAVA